MLAEFATVEPQFHTTHDIGYIGFTYYKESFVSRGIAYFTKWSRMSDITVTHALIVTGENQCTEALFDGVQRSPLTKYFDDPKCAIFFRKPRAWTEDIGSRIAGVAQSQEGVKYEYGLIVADALKGTFLGHLIDGCFKGEKEDILTKFLNDDKGWICSELAAYALEAQPEYRDKGVLHRDCATINPQELFEDQVIFDPWHLA